MKYLKTYENIKNDPEVGDYVIVYNDNWDKELNNFTKNNVGNVVFTPSSSFDQYLIFYENVPVGLNRRVYREDIKYFSNNKRNVKRKIDLLKNIDKYNL